MPRSLKSHKSHLTMFRTFAAATISFLIAFNAQAEQCPTAVVGGPYKAVILAGKGTQRVLDSALSRAVFDAETTEA